MSNKTGLLTVTILFYFTSSTIAQQDSIDLSSFGGIFTLDSMTVIAKRKGFDVGDFVSMVKEDVSFYQAFRNLRFQTYQSKSEINLFDKKGKIKASYKSSILQEAEDLCRRMTILDESHSGNYYKKGEVRYYTSKLHNRLFYTNGQHCERTKAFNGLPDSDELSGMNKHINELKKLIFTPGQKADVPLLGNKTAIFDPKMVKYYDFKIEQRPYIKTGKDCYVFIATAKPEFKKDKTVIKFLETYFEKNSLQVVARDYTLSYNSALYDFDVTMKIELTKVGNEYLPKFINYDGLWDIPFQKPEIAKFNIDFDFE